MRLGQQKDQYRISIENKVDNPLATIISFNQQFQLGEKEKEAGITIFHVAKAFTRAAQSEGLSGKASYRLQKVGGAILEIVK